jgi:hypothetical protein
MTFERLPDYLRKTLLAALLCVVAGCASRTSDRNASGQDPNSINTPAGKPPPQSPGPPVPDAQPGRFPLTRPPP